MPRREKRYHFLYKTTNLLNGKFYVGMHTTDDLEDGYLGSGLRLRRSVKKYGAKNFKHEILEFFEDRKMMAAREREVVNEKLLEDPLCMNIMKGGEGGRGFISVENQRKRSIAGAAALVKKRRSDPVLMEKHLNKMREFFKDLHKAGKIKYDTFTNRTHSDKTKIKMSDKASKRVGEKNSQFGSFWVTNGKENKKIKKDNPIPDGWYRGRNLDG